MLNAFLFKADSSERIEDWQAALDGLASNELLWIAARNLSEQEERALEEGLSFGDAQLPRLREAPERASLAADEEHLYLTLVAVAGDPDSPHVVPVGCVIGENWILTTHPHEVAVLEEFLERAEGGGQIGELDAASFVAAIGEWVVSSYLRAFEDIEADLEELDAKVISETPQRDVSRDLGRLVELRRRVGTLRRALAPHREIVISLAHPELDTFSTEDSAERFAALESRVAQALEAARDTKESIFGSFDLIVARVGQRTNDIMKVLTLVTVTLLPATVLAGVMGMNFQVGLFDQTWIFWVVIGLMVSIAVLVLSVARVWDWI